MTSALVALVLVQSPATVFDRSLVAHRQLRRFSATIETEARSDAGLERATWDIVSDGSTVLLRVRQPARGELDRSDRRFLLQGARLVGYDAIANEVLTRSAGAKGDLATRLEEPLGGLEEAVAALLSPERLRTIYARLRAMPGWKLGAGPGVTKLTLSQPKQKALQSARVVVGAKDFRLRELHMQGQGSQLTWRVRYGAARTPALDVPTDARRVSAFTVAERPPSFASREASEAHRRLLKAAGSLRSGTVVIRADDGVVRVVFDQRRVREGQANVVWMFDGATLTIHNRRAGRYYRGPAKRSDVIDLVGSAGGRVDPFTRNILLRRVPFKEAFEGGSRVSIAGSVQVRGVDALILRGVAPRRNVTLFLRKDNGLPSSLGVELRDASGERLSESNRAFEYLRLNVAQPADEFRLPLPKGLQAQPLPPRRLFPGG